MGELHPKPKPYCWQVALQQSLLPLQVCNTKLNEKRKKDPEKFGLQHRRVGVSHKKGVFRGSQ